jgi:hypothetical protein
MHYSESKWNIIRNQVTYLCDLLSNLVMYIKMTVQQRKVVAFDQGLVDVHAFIAYFQPFFNLYLFPVLINVNS